MSVIKVLPLPKFVANVNGFLDDPCGHLTPTLPMIHRNGWYYDRLSGECWYEHDGKAWEADDADMFLWELKMKNHRPLRKRERTAIRTLMDGRICPKSLCDSYWTDTHALGLIETRRGTMKIFLRSQHD